MLNVFSEKIKPKTRFAIVLDIDETLVHTLFDNEDIRNKNLESYEFTIIDAANRYGEGIVAKIKGYKRKNVKEFLSELFEIFRYVIIWSAGREKYVREIVKILFKDIGYPHAIFTYNDCEEYNGVIVKPLTKVAKTLNIDIDDIIVVDDREASAALNKNNAIIIPEFRNEEDDDLLILLEMFRKLDNEVSLTVINKKIFYD